MSDDQKTVAGEIEAYLNSDIFFELSNQTQSEYWNVGEGLRGTIEDIPLSEVSQAWVLGLIGTWQIAGQGAATRMLQVLKNALKRALYAGEIPLDSFRNLKADATDQAAADKEAVYLLRTRIRSALLLKRRG